MCVFGNLQKAKMPNFDDNQLSLREWLGRIANLGSDHMIFSWTGQFFLFKDRDMKAIKWQYQIIDEFVDHNPSTCEALNNMGE